MLAAAKAVTAGALVFAIGGVMLIAQPLQQQGSMPAGRTQTMFSPTKAITAGALVFAIGGVMLIAQPLQQQGSVPGAATDDESVRPALATGFVIWPDGTSDTYRESYQRTTMPDGTFREVWTDIASVEMNDPRLTGAYTIEYAVDRFDDSGTDLGWGTVRIENDAGFWEGTSVGTSDPTALGREVSYYELIGGGAYEGLSAIVFETEMPAHEWAWSGLIFPGNQPPNR